MCCNWALNTYMRHSVMTFVGPFPLLTDEMAFLLETSFVVVVRVPV
jgi:hypothetical protein